MHMHMNRADVRPWHVRVPVVVVSSSLGIN